MTQQALKIGELATQTGSSVETIRYYEQQNLLPQASRSASNYRLYGEEHVKRLQFIRHCRSLDMTLDEIRTLLAFQDTPEGNCAGVNTLLDRHIEHVANRIKELKALQIELKELRNSCLTIQSVEACGILQNLASAEDTDPKNLGSHSGGCH
ncbi:Cd(II)/Pb(II)-responsive transcriptional regulator [Herminiimonas arsenitoxidans]|uniref:Cd(II)/Pb(II)-responsive transcriptional regulator n=1 Tax=Herminiimonas arsenitoxidans TaxID=1809410 RepID=UPI000970F539|nr:Cd(II)/Pb(II)-responsive transcriptional regulator [Herminiimonas arsenitoxidans]